MHVLDSCNQLAEILDRLLFFESFFLDDQLEQLPLRDILHDEEELFGRLNNLV